MIEFKLHDKTVRFVKEVGQHYLSNFERGQFYEDDFLNYVTALRETGTYLDIGGNVANHSIYWALFSQAERIHSFEPLKPFREIAEKNIELNDVSGVVTMNPFGLGAKAETLHLTFNNFSDHVEIKLLDELTVPEPVTILKIDIEGMEPTALKGGQKLIAEQKPIIYCEVIQNEGSADFDASAVDAVLMPLGYRPTGRVFNYQPTVEYSIPDSPADKRLRAKTQRQILPMTDFKATNEKTQITHPSSESMLIGLNDSSKVYVTNHVGGYDEPSKAPETRIIVTGDDLVFLEIEANTTETATVAALVNQYADTGQLNQDRIYINRRKFTPLNIHPDATSLSIVLLCSGSGEVHVRKLALTRINA